MYGLNPQILEKFRSIFSKYPDLEVALLFGSRAMGNFREGSDIDIVLKGENLNLTQLQMIDNELDDLNLPYKIDICLYHQISNTDLLDHIQRVGITLFQKPAL